MAVDVLDEAVIASLRETFSAERFEQYLGEQAANTAKVAEQRELRARLVDEELPRLAKVVARLTKSLATIDDDDAATEIQGELKKAVQERKAVEAHILDLETHERALQDQAAEVERLRAVWGTWAGALADGVRGPELVVRARALMKKVLLTPIWVRPIEGGNGSRSWRFVGVARYDRVLAGGLTGTEYFIEDRPGVVDPDGLFLWFAEAAGDTAPRPADRVVMTYGKGGERRLIEIHSTEPIEIEEEGPSRPPMAGAATPTYTRGVFRVDAPPKGPPYPPRSAPRRSRGAPRLAKSRPGTRRVPQRRRADRIRSQISRIAP